MKPEIAVIGAGRLGRLLAAELRRDYRVVVADRRASRTSGFRAVPVAEAAARPIVVLAVPAANLRALLAEIAPALRPGALVCDTCAVKEAPVRWMKALLPPHVEILGLHPLFGPGSAASGLAGRTIVVTPGRIGAARLARVIRSLRSCGLVVRKATPAAHDRAMASTLFVAQFVGRALLGVVASRPSFTTPSAEMLRAIVRTASLESPALLRDLYAYNRFAREVPASLARACSLLQERLEEVLSS